MYSAHIRLRSDQRQHQHGGDNGQQKEQQAAAERFYLFLF